MAGIEERLSPSTHYYHRASRRLRRRRGDRLLSLARRGGEAADRGDREGIIGLPPTVSAGFAAATENGTWIAGGGHFASWKEDHVRFTGGGGYANINVAFFRGNVSQNFNISGYLITLEVEHRLGNSDLFLGLGYDYTGLGVKLVDGMGGTLPLEIDDSIGGIKPEGAERRWSVWHSVLGFGADAEAEADLD